MKVVTIFLSILTIGYATDSAFDAYTTNHDDVHTGDMGFDCNGIPFCDEVKEMQRRIETEPGFADQFPVHDVTDIDDLLDTELDTTEPGTFRSQSLLSRTLRSAIAVRKKKNAQANPVVCPTYTDEYLSNTSLKLRDLSLSPWRMVIKRNPNRVPDQMVVSECLCERCIDPKTRTEFLPGALFKSVPIKYKRYVRLLNTGESKLIQASLGCRCDIIVPSTST